MINKQIPVNIDLSLKRYLAEDQNIVTRSSDEQHRATIYPNQTILTREPTVRERVNNFNSAVYKTIGKVEADLKELNILERIPTSADIIAISNKVLKESDFQQQLTSLQSNVEDNYATKVELDTVVVDADNKYATASSLTSLQSNIENNYSTTNVINATYATKTTVGAIYGLDVNANGHISGYKSIATGDISIFQIYAEKFLISSSSTDEGYSPFQIDTVNHAINLSSNVFIDGKVTVMSNIDANSIDPTTIPGSAIPTLESVDTASKTAEWASISGLLPEDKASTGLQNVNITINSDGTLSGAGTGQVTTTGIGAETPVGAQTKADTAEANARAYVDTNFVLTTTHTNDLSQLQNQIDKNITSWFSDGEPTLTNVPASDWTDNATKNIHLGDLYYDNTTGYSYRFRLDNTTYSWVKLSDSDITQALVKAQTAQDTADGKRRVFVDTPVVPYDVGDLWDVGNGIVRRATISKIDTFNSSDWVDIANYTTKTSELSDDAQLGITAAWSSVSGSGKPMDNATAGAFYNININDDWEYGLRTAGKYSTNTDLYNSNVLSIRQASSSDVLAPSDRGILQIRQGSPIGTTDKISIYLHQLDSGSTLGFPAVAGRKYAASAYVGAHRCTAYIRIAFRDSSNKWIGVVASNYNVGIAGAANESSSTLLSVAGIAPTNTAYVQIIVYKSDTDAGQTDSYVFVHKPMLAEVPLDSTYSNTKAIPYFPTTVSGAVVEAKANLAEVTAKAYADGIVTDEEARAIADAQAKADLAEANALSHSEQLAAMTTGVIPSYTNSNYSTISIDKASNTLRLYSTLDTTIGMTLKPFRVNIEKADKYIIKFMYKTDTAATSGFYARIYEYDNDLVAGKTHIVQSTTGDIAEIQAATRRKSITGLPENSSTSTSWTKVEVTYIPTNTAKWAGLTFLNWSGLNHDKLYITGIDVIKSSTVQDVLNDPSITMDANRIDPSTIPNSNIPTKQSVLDAESNAVTTSLARLNAVADDDIISIEEKPLCYQAENAVNNEQNSLVAVANTYLIVEDRDAYTNSITALNSYLSSLSGWADNTVSTPVVKADFLSTFSAVYYKRDELSKAIVSAHLYEQNQITKYVNSVYSAIGQLNSSIDSAIYYAGSGIYKVYRSKVSNILYTDNFYLHAILYAYNELQSAVDNLSYDLETFLGSGTEYDNYKQAISDFQTFTQPYTIDTGSDQEIVPNDLHTSKSTALDATSNVKQPILDGEQSYYDNTAIPTINNLSKVVNTVVEATLQVNYATTTIDGGKITTGTLRADQMFSSRLVNVSAYNTDGTINEGAVTMDINLAEGSIYIK